MRGLILEPDSHLNCEETPCSTGFFRSLGISIYGMEGRKQVWPDREVELWYSSQKTLANAIGALELDRAQTCPELWSGSGFFMP